ncbi:MAG: asparagine synthase-related protein [Ignavibacteria bacterium]|jgi:asparagine synthase (glutamine-hydrolysing)
MSIIFGIFNRNGKQVANELEEIICGINHFPHEKQNYIIKNNCGFGHLLTYNTPEAVHESMPKWIDDAKTLFVAEGRIDNREELFNVLSIPSNQQKTIPDGDLILKAYLKWGEKCTDKLLGKWSFASYHKEEQRLFIARDKWDYTAIDYYIDDRVIAFASSSKGLFNLPFIKKEIDELMIARMLVVWPGDYDKTYYRGIKRLLPSHTLTVTRGNTKLHRYWNYSDIKMKEGLKLEDYVEYLFDNFNKAVKARLRSYKPVASTLSGGMDSSSVSVIAAEHLAKEGKRLKTYSHIPRFNPSNSLTKHSFGNEKPFIDAIVEKYENIDPVFLQSKNISPIEGIKEAIKLYGEPFHGAGNAFWMVDIYKTAIKHGYGTVLMGEFGNSTISWTGIEDALPANEILKFYGILSVIKKKILKPVFYGDTPIAKIYKRIVFGKTPWRKISYTNKEFEESLKLAEKIKAACYDSTFKWYFKEPKQKANLIFDYNVMRLPWGAYMGNETGLELRDPTNDVRVIESSLSIPNEMYLGKMNKWVLREMMKGYLPDIVRLNKTKGKQSSDLNERICAYAEEMDDVLFEMDRNGFGKIADIKRIKNEWTKIKADNKNYPLNDIFHILRHVAFYLMWNEN